MQSIIFYPRTTKESFIASTAKASSFKMRKAKEYGEQREKEKWTAFLQKLAFTLSEGNQESHEDDQKFMRKAC